VKLLRSSNEATGVVVLSALILLEREDSVSAEGIPEVGIVEALLELLRCHQCEDTASEVVGGAGVGGEVEAEAAVIEGVDVVARDEAGVAGITRERVPGVGGAGSCEVAPGAS
jgi:hypothetical protein